ncbi:TIGR03619 family F420-dependent LLM class oxidoreductase [Streptomyces sp. NRRL B-1677]|uniref:TIGR03619 family F420-dependent LLM class oxidoreductase n=1 Tax=Streptomyces sp. NRRL B-1677 TaxID=2682966 RepID=UPI001892A742|nr:TIGR03619 family F420-dependent LLM class oxidoreductase [Streptomyces sp. NRRL B-1677]MBF6050183.1 TIGR03619 family F420-dependent LLM class oxidoreductase [Streptomyces sp. NRRL B-1677]
MKIGIALPQFGDHARAELVAGFARDAEAAGFDSLWVGDRALAPVAPSDLYPGYTPDNPYPPGFKTVLDPLTVLTVAAAATSRVRLGTSTLNAPWYPPLLLARTLTSIDQVSNGRLDAGLGIGWMRDEHAAVNSDFSKRGARLDEILDILHGIWSEDVFGHEGGHWTIPRSYFGLHPVQRPGPPVLLGGVSAAAMRRIGSRADGWVGITLPPEARAGLWATARRAAEEAGRDPDALQQHIRHNPGPDASSEDIAAVLADVRDSGADGCFIDLHQSVPTPERALELGIKTLERVRSGR